MLIVDAQVHIWESARHPGLRLLGDHLGRPSGTKDEAASCAGGRAGGKSRGKVVC